MGKPEHSSATHPDLINKPGVSNWVEKAGHLPKYIERIAKHLVSDQGFTESRAIATAVNTVKKWATGLNHNGSRISAATQAKAAAAYAEWKAKAASSSVTTTRQEAPVTIELSHAYKKTKAKLDAMSPDQRNKLRDDLKKGKAAAEAEIEPKGKAKKKKKLIPRGKKPANTPPPTGKADPRKPAPPGKKVSRNKTPGQAQIVAPAKKKKAVGLARTAAPAKPPVKGAVVKPVGKGAVKPSQPVVGKPGQTPAPGPGKPEVKTGNKPAAGVSPQAAPSGISDVAGLKTAIAAWAKSGGGDAAKASITAAATRLKATHLLPAGWVAGSSKSPKQAPVKKRP